MTSDQWNYFALSALTICTISLVLGAFGALMGRRTIQAETPDTSVVTPAPTPEPTYTQDQLHNAVSFAVLVGQNSIIQFTGPSEAARGQAAREGRELEKQLQERYGIKPHLHREEEGK